MLTLCFSASMLLILPYPSGNAAAASPVADLSICIRVIGVAALFCAIAGMVKNTRIAVGKKFLRGSFPFRSVVQCIYLGITVNCP
jgi:hypothetical protein